MIVTSVHPRRLARSLRYALLWRLGTFSPDFLCLASDLRMYHNSSQKRHWTFASEEQLARLRADANRKFKCKAVANGKVRTPRLPRAPGL